MQFFICKAKRKCWTNKGAREALNIESGDTIRITHGNQSVDQQVRRAPLSASRVLRAIQTATGALGIAVESSILSRLNCRPGDAVEVVNLRAVEESRPAAPRSTSSTSRPMVTNGGGGGGGGTLADKLNALKVGQTVEVSESAAKSGAYTVAKKLGIKIRRVPGKNVVERVS